jgi:carbamoyltransferase
MDLARSIQDITEEAMLKMAVFAHRQTGMRDLCMAGGVALNCVGNGRIQREGPFEQIWVQPAAGDAGGALGVALGIWHRHLNKPRQSPEQGWYVGAAGPRHRRRSIRRRSTPTA